MPLCSFFLTDLSFPLILSFPAANDQGGLVRLHHYPCVVRHAPGKEYPGHSSHVTNLRFMRDGELMMTTGGNDRSVVVWEVRKDESLLNTDTFRR